MEEESIMWQPYYVYQNISKIEFFLSRQSLDEWENKEMGTNILMESHYFAQMNTELDATCQNPATIQGER